MHRPARRCITLLSPDGILARDPVMHPYISCLFTLAVKPEAFAEFKALIAQIVAAT
jgi:hypothetical protein